MNFQLCPKLTLTYDHVRYVGMKVNLQGPKILILGISAPNEDKTAFYKRLMNELLEFSYENWYVLGHWNGMVFLQKDRTSGKNSTIAQSKLSKVFF